MIPMTLDGFDVHKAAHAAAYFAQECGGPVSVRKICNLLYLSDRRSLAEFDLPILFDAFVDLPIGPTGWAGYEHLGGLRHDAAFDTIFDRVVSRDSSYALVLRRRMTLDDLDRLSEDDISSMRSTWLQLSEKTDEELDQFMKISCPEWQASRKIPVEISYEAVFKGLGKKNAEMLAAHVEAARALSVGMQGSELYSSPSWNAPHSVRPAARP